MPSAIIIGQGGGGGTGGGGNASVGLTGAVAPTSATEIGIIVAGNLQGVSNANPLPITGSITASNPSVGTIGATAPTSATFLGVVNGSGNLEGVGSANPIRIDPTGTTAQPILLTGHAGATLDGTAGSPSTGVITIQGVSGGTTVPVSGTVVADGDGTSNAASVVWNVTTGTLNAAISLVNNTFQYNYVNVQLVTTSTVTGGAVTFEASLDNSNWYTLPAFKIGSTVQTLTTYVLVANTTIAFAFNISGWQYFRIRLSTAFAGTGQVTVGYAAASNGQFYNYAGESTFGSYLVVANNNGVGVADGTNALTMANSGAGANGIQAVAVSVFTGASNANTVLQRTPAIFTGGQGTGGSAFLVANPQTTKKFRAMKYMIDVAEDATITSGPLPINIGFRYGLPNSLAATFIGSRSTMFDFSHRVVIPASVLATSFDGFVSDWVDLGNGVIPTVSGQPLYCGIQAIQPTSAVTPTWTLATTGQWEAGCAAFTTTGGRGAFKLRQYAVTTAGTNSTTLALSGARGTAVFVLVRSTNIAAGAPTFTITDTAGNSWTKLTIITNASDGAHGSSLELIYCLNMVGTDASLGSNTILVTGTVNAPTGMTMIVSEYSNVVAADASAQTTGTGNSTAPAAGAYSPTSTGDLVLTYAATSTGQATCPQLGTAGFFAFSEQGGTSVPCLMLGDNWGSGSLATGLVNVVVVGTEE